jgi:hypothetical protein
LSDVPFDLSEELRAAGRAVCREYVLDGRDASGTVASGLAIFDESHSRPHRCAVPLAVDLVLDVQDRGVHVVPSLASLPDPYVVHILQHYNTPQEEIMAQHSDTARMPRGKCRMNIYVTEELAERLERLRQIDGNSMSVTIEGLCAYALDTMLSTRRVAR